jgi:hypothetical protein
MVVLLELSIEYPIAEIGCDLQSAPEAATAKGELTLAPVAGCETVTSETDAGADATVTGTSAVHDAPLLPHDFTCRTWLPMGALTLAVIELLLTMVVLLLLSSE